jgi:hypothetical protein
MNDLKSPQSLRLLQICWLWIDRNPEFRADRTSVLPVTWSWRAAGLAERVALCVILSLLA